MKPFTLKMCARVVPCARPRVESTIEDKAESLFIEESGINMKTICYRRFLAERSLGEVLFFKFCLDQNGYVHHIAGSVPLSRVKASWSLSMAQDPTHQKEELPT